MACCNSKQGIEGGVTRFAPVEAEDKFIEVGLQMFAAQAVIDAKPPAFQVGKQPVDAGHDDVCRHRPDDVRIVAHMGHTGVGGKPIRFGGCAGDNIVLQECVQRAGAIIRDDTKPRPAEHRLSLLSGPDFGGSGDQQLAIVAVEMLV